MHQVIMVTLYGVETNHKTFKLRSKRETVIGKN